MVAPVEPLPVVVAPLVVPVVPVPVVPTKPPPPLFTAPRLDAAFVAALPELAPVGPAGVPTPGTGAWPGDLAVEVPGATEPGVLVVVPVVAPPVVEAGP